MSKLFDETQKTQQSLITMSGPRPLNIGSLVDSFKQNGVVVTVDLLETGLPARRNIDVGKATTCLPTGLKSDDLSAAPAIEAYRSLRTRLMKLLASHTIHSITITSSIPGEGKTVTALNLAISCAQLHDMRILLVDGDLRSRGLTRLLKIPEGTGLSDILSGKCAVDGAVLATERKNLFLVGAGSLSSQPAELYAGARWAEFIDWANKSFNIILIDAPPIFSVADAELISACCDGTLMVVKPFATPREIAAQCARRLPKRKFLGAIFNGVPDCPDGRYSYYEGPNGNQKG
jgi:capsular exopolysaccharide synthesis family protein